MGLWRTGPKDPASQTSLVLGKLKDLDLSQAVLGLLTWWAER